MATPPTPLDQDPPAHDDASPPGPARAHTGRTPILQSDPGITDRICEIVKLGATYRDACGAVGISAASLHLWVSKGKREGPPTIYTEFYERIARARRAGQAGLVRLVHSAAREGDWKAAQYLLACRDPQAYGTRNHHEHSGPSGAPIAVEVYDAIRIPTEDDV